MLIPGMNGHGLGPGTSEHTFGHGGADEGFRAWLVAWKDTADAAVIMVNSDNGKILRELMLSVAREYDLPGIEPDIKTIAVMEEAKLSKYAGKYKIPQMGEVQVSLKNDGLELRAEFIDDPVYIVPENETSFFDRADGTSIKFLIEDGKILGFEIQGMKADIVE